MRAYNILLTNANANLWTFIDIYIFDVVSLPLSFMHITINIHIYTTYTTYSVAPRKPELIIRESQPIELPPGVVRSSDKTDLGLSDLQQLNVRERYNMFENGRKEESHQMLDREEHLIKRGTTVLSKLAK